MNSMKRIVTTIIFLLVAYTAVFAQPDKNKEKDRERIKALKVAFITEKVNLKTDQAEKFWPVYNRYEKERHDIKRGFLDKYAKENPSVDKHAAHEYINDNIEYQEQVLNLKKKYKDEMLKVISAQQLATLYDAERDFKQMLLKELGDRHKGPTPSNK